MNIPYNCVKGTSNNEGLTIWNDKHNCQTDFWKGVVTDEDGRVVARSYQRTPVVSATEVPEDLSYYPIMEATVLRFYRHQGVPMISTHRTIDISRTNSRVGTGRPFIELVKDAVELWPKEERRFEHEGENALAYTPSYWEDLCVDGWCHVFLLVDQSNQKTDLVDLSMYNGPQLIYTMSLRADTPAMTPYPTIPIDPITPATGGDILGNEDETVYHYLTWIVPTLPILSKEQADTLLAEGKGVIGFKLDSKDLTTKYISPSYRRKLELLNDNTNMVHRWHELMDESEELAKEYLVHLPYTLQYMNDSYMRDVSDKYLDETTAFITNSIADRVMGVYSPMSEELYKKVRDIVNPTVTQIKRRYKTTVPRREKVIKDITPLVRRELLALSYSMRHSYHSEINRENLRNSRQQ